MAYAQVCTLHIYGMPRKYGIINGCIWIIQNKYTIYTKSNIISNISEVVCHLLRFVAMVYSDVII